jgi:hypothetical protein
MSNLHELMGGKPHLYLRGNNQFWQCSASVGGKQWRTTTKLNNSPLPRKWRRIGIWGCVASRRRVRW